MPASISNEGGVAPQATSTMGMPAPPPQNVTATGNSSATTVLNPFGPRNELLQGGIVCDLPGICYSQYVQIKNQLEVSDDTVPWTVIAQLPYDPTSEYMNEYCRRYARAHQRYNGDIMYQIEVIGNASYSGTIIVAWVPERLSKTIADPADLQTYSYKTMSVTLPSVEQFILKDARQTEYYRTHDSDVSRRPHLVIAVHTSIVSPLRTGITVRLRIATRFASMLDQRLYGAQPFFLSNPVFTPLGPSVQSNVFDGRALGDIFPQMYYAGMDYRMCVDGAATVAGTGLIEFPGRRARTFESYATQIVDTEDLISPALLCNNNVFVFGCSDFTPIGIRQLIYSADNLKTKSLDEIVEALSKSTAIVEGLVQRNQKAVVSWASGTIHLQVDALTNKGRVTVWVYQGQSGQSAIELPPTSAHYGLPYSSVTGVTDYLTNAISGLPLNWRNVTISSEPVTTVMATDVAPSAYCDSIIQGVIEAAAAKVPPDSILQFDLEDPESRQRVTTLRWSTERRALVMATNDPQRYALYPSDIRKLIVGNWSSVPKASGFPNSIISQWASRTPAIERSGFRVRNAALVAEFGEALGAEGALEAAPAFAEDSSLESEGLFAPHPSDFKTMLQDFLLTLLI